MIGFLGIGVGPLILLGWLAYDRSRDALLAKSSEALQLHAAGAVDKMDRNLFERYGDVQAFAANPQARRSPAEITEAANFYTKLYVIYDLMLIADASGKIIAANTIDADGKPIDTSKLIGRSVRNEPWFQKIIGGEIKAGQTEYTDLESDPWVKEAFGGEGRNLAFSAPIFDESGKVVGAWSNRASWKRIVGQIADELHEGLAAAGITPTVEVVTRDGVLLESRARDDQVLKLNLAEAGSPAARGATEKRSGFVEELGKDGSLRTVGFAAAKGALGFAGYGWGVLVGADQTNLLQSVDQLRSFILAIVAVASLLVAILALFMARSIVGPVQDTVTVLEAVAGGDLKHRVRVRTQDEIGRMGESLNSALDAISKMITQIRSATTMLACSAEQLTASSDEQSEIAEKTLQQASVAATASDEISRNIHTVASGAEEMSASITEIAKNAADAASATEEGSATAREANERVGLLDASSREIGQVSDTIKKIAEQTNVLAASASSQADQAEKASKGFAVVAYEVKDLAKQTSESTSRIETRITAIQKDTSSAMSSIATIGGTVSRIEEISGRIHDELERAIEALRQDDSTADGAQRMRIESLAGVVRQAKEAALVAQQAVTTIRKVDAEVNQLGKSSNEVGEVIRVIDTIARQTNLLALNAAIEAQRAGDAARGFGGVAEQVKTLARRTGDATSEIRAKIDSIQGETQATVTAMREIGTRVDKITDISATIASAVEEQSASAMEITRCVSDAARGASEIAENITLVKETALSTSKAGSDTRTAATELSRLASELQESVSRFET